MINTLNNVSNENMKLRKQITHIVSYLNKTIQRSLLDPLHNAMPELVAELSSLCNLNLKDLEGISSPMFIPNEDVNQLIEKTNKSLEMQKMI